MTDEHFAHLGTHCRYSSERLMPQECISDEGLSEADATVISTESLEGRPPGADGFVNVPSCPVRGTPPQDQPSNRLGTCRVRRFLLEAGSGIDLVSRGDVQFCQDFMRPCGSKLTLCTANGELPASEKEQTGLNIGPFAADTTALVLGETPSVLTVGRRCIVEGYGFHWFPYQNPFTDHPTLGRIEHEVEHYVPYLRVGEGEIIPFISTGSIMPVAAAGPVVGAAVTHATTKGAKVTLGEPRRVRTRARTHAWETQPAEVNDDSRGECLSVPVAVG